MRRFTRFRLLGFLLLCVCLLGAIGITIVQTRTSHAAASDGIGSNNWEGTGDYGSGTQSFPMSLNLDFSDNASPGNGSLSGTLTEGNSVVAISGAFENGNQGTNIAFEDTKSVQGNGIVLNVYYAGVITYPNAEIKGTWYFPGSSQPNGTFDLQQVFN